MGLALFFIHVLLLFLPPIPPDIKGSLWDYLSGYLAVAFLAVEFGRRRSSLAAWWATRSRGRQWAAGLGLALATLGLVLAVRSLSPSLFARFSREEGLWEPATLLCYLGSAILLLGTAGGLVGAERRHWRLIAALYVLMGLEEIDYFGIFGGMIGRVHGMYAGSLHDLILLAVEGALSPTAWVLVAGLFLLVLVLLRWTGYLQPRAIVAMIGSFDFLWIIIGLWFLLAAAAAEAGVFELAARPPTLEEGLELAGAICFFCYALAVAAGRCEPA